ncbi:hypothetical protein [Novosphingobium sp. RL4]|uniref:hypothetical protein n=1 Tax=Novosphingobium sp. RL4 TaxID=3109595 RepID=UPI002D76EF77|nr:hypothetical protein [Novosphingobium sp. RL4]WRT91880.1 hypothetical protein U9J33_11725 [Novosphingobium sp. RL4]
MAEQLPPEWAIERAIELGDNPPSPNVKQVVESPHAYHGYIAFARYIAEHEEAPVDPLLIEARALVAARYNDSFGAEHKAATLAGEDDSSEPIRNCLIALRRGIEIGRAS